MTESRSDKKGAKAKVAIRRRKANSVAELELMFTIGALYIAHYYDCHPVLRFFAKLGLRNAATSDRYMERAQLELSDCDYDFQVWKHKYGSCNTRSLVRL